MSEINSGKWRLSLVALICIFSLISVSAAFSEKGPWVVSIEKSGEKIVFADHSESPTEGGWILLAVILISIFLDLGFARILLLPFNRIVNKKLKDVQHPSTFDATPVKTSTYEFAQLDRSINEMMLKIKETFQIEREFITNFTFSK